MKFYPLSGIHVPGKPNPQLWRIMRLTFILLTAFFLQVSATTSAQQVTLSKDRITLKQVFNEIRKQTGYIVLYQADEVDVNKTVSVQLDHVALKDAMSKILENQNLDFTIEDQSIVIKKKEISPTDELKAQVRREMAQVTVSGKVQDELGKPMPGVTVKQKDNPANGTVTDAKGSYTIAVPDDKTIIVFSFIGYETQELAAKYIPAGSAITMKVAENNLREVVISKGYYDEKQALSTGNVSVVTAKQIEEQPVSDPIEALKARVPGLYIQQSSGAPGSYAQIEIRGQNSIANGNDPLYIVDGVPFNSQSPSDNSGLIASSLGTPFAGTISNMTGQVTSGLGMSPFMSLNPADIETIEVLKDADATAIYGSRGANGVILITTKKGKAGDTRVDASIQSGASSVAKTMNLLNTQQYLQMRRIAFANDGLPVPSIATDPSDPNYDINGVWDATRHTNWQKVLIGNTDNFTNAQVDISGGTANTQFRIGLGFNSQGTVYPGDYSDKRASGSFNLTHSSSDQRFHLQFNGGYSYNHSDLPQVDLTRDIVLAPDAPTIYNSDGSLNWQIYNGSATWQNPLAYTVQTANSETYDLNSSLTVSYKLLEGLEIKSVLGYHNQLMNQTDLVPSTYYAPPNNLSSHSTNASANTNYHTWTIDPQLSYQRKFSKGELNALLGSTFEDDGRNALSYYGVGFTNDALIGNPTAASTQALYHYDTYQYRYTSIYSRVGFTWDDKYLLNITGRRDGSSRFGPGKEFGNFGAAGAGWVFSKERFIEDGLPWLSFGKLRASYGSSGNDQIPNYQYLSTYGSLYQSYQGINGLYATGLQNPKFAWEVNKKLEGGLELGFLKDRIDLTVSYFRNRTSNELIPYQLPFVTGFTYIEENLHAVVQNTGAEFELHTSNVKGKDFTWSTSFNMTIPTNKLLSFPNLATSSYADLYVIGKPLSMVRTFHYTGVDAQTGLYTYETSNTNGIPAYPQDLVTSVTLTQKFYGGLQNSFRYKGFQLDLMFQFVSQKKFNYLDYFNMPGGFSPNNSNEPTIVLKAWQSVGNQSSIEKFTSSSASQAAAAYAFIGNSDAMASDASFIRLQTISFSYTFPNSWQNTLHLKNTRLYIQGQNLLTFTHYLGLDPESGALNLPPLRTITGGLQTSF